MEQYMNMNGMNGFNIPQGTGFQFNPNAQAQAMANQPRQTNNLTEDEIQKVIAKESQFSLQITETERLRAICNHRKADGTGDAIVEDEDGNCVCQICGYKFRPIDPSTTLESLQASVNEVVDIAQTIKLLFINMNKDAAREYWMFIPLVEKLPGLFQMAVKDWKQHESFNNFGYNNRNMGTMNLFQMLAGALYGQPYAQQGAQQAASGAMNMGMGYTPGFSGYGQPFMQAAPGMNPAYANPMSNGFGFGPAPQQYNPAMQGYAYNPQQMPPVQVPPTAAEAPKSAEGTTATTDGKTVEVNTAFKA